MAVDNGAYIADMEVGIPANTDPRYEGAAQIRAVKRMVKDSFPNVNDAITADSDTINYMTDGTQGRFIGETTMFQGLIEDIPDGWVLSDGTIQNGYLTMDLRDKFVLGYDDVTSTLRPVRHEGGDHDGHGIITLPDHTHDRGSMEITGRMERISETWNRTGSEAIGAFEKETGYPQGGTPESTDTSNAGAVQFRASNTWTGVTGTPDYGTGDGTIGEERGNMPAYVVLAFIVYVGKTV